MKSTLKAFIKFLVFWGVLFIVMAINIQMVKDGYSNAKTGWEYMISVYPYLALMLTGFCGMALFKTFYPSKPNESS